MGVTNELTVSEYRRMKRKENPLQCKIYAARTALRWLGWTEADMDAAIINRLEQLGENPEEGRRKR